MDSLNISSCPSQEECVQVTREGEYSQAMRAECHAFIEALRRLHGEEPEGARLYMKSNSHDFGTYHEVECKFDPDIPAAVDYAFKCESESPQTWDEVGMTCPWTRQGHNYKPKFYTNDAPSPNFPQPETWGKWSKGKVNP